MKCFDCGGEVILIRKSIVRYDGVNVENVYLRNAEVEYCRSCGTESTVIRNIKDIHSNIALALTLQPGRLTGSEVRFIRKAMRMSSEEMATKVDLAPETYSRWENGRSPSLATEKLFRLNFLAFAGHTEGLGELLANDLLGLREYGLVLDVANPENRPEYARFEAILVDIPTKSNLAAHTTSPLEMATVVGIRSVGRDKINQLCLGGDLLDAGTLAAAA